jgi:hypothetical protein
MGSNWRISHDCPVDASDSKAAFADATKGQPGRQVISVDPHVIRVGSPWKLGVSSGLAANFDPSRIQNLHATLPR